MKRKPLTVKEREILIVLWAYADEGNASLTVRELFDAAQDAGVPTDDFDWKDYSFESLRLALLTLNSISFVKRTDRPPARWSLTARGRAYMDAPEEGQQRLVDDGHDEYLARFEEALPKPFSVAGLVS